MRGWSGILLVVCFGGQEDWEIVKIAAGPPEGFLNHLESLKVIKLNRGRLEGVPSKHGAR